MKRLLGKNLKKGNDIYYPQLLEGEELLMVGKEMFAVKDYFCEECGGCGCKKCKWSGEQK